MPSLADVDPFGPGQRRNVVWRYANGGVGRTCGGQHFGMLFQGNVAEDRQGIGQTEGTYAAYGMACHCHDILGTKHSRLDAETVFELAIVQPLRSRCNNEKDAITRFEANGLRNLIGVDTVRLRSQIDGGGAFRRLYHRNLRCMDSEIFYDRMEAHA